MVKWEGPIKELLAKDSLELADIRLNLVNLLAKRGLPPDVLADIFYFKGLIDGELERRSKLDADHQRANRAAELFAADKERNGDDSWRIEG